MSVTIIECEQNTEEWLRARMGRPTASMMATIISSPSGRTEIPVRLKYMYQLAFEILTDEPMQTYQNDAMRDGHDAEPVARSMFEFISDKKVQTVGFVTNDSIVKGRVIGCSPDGLIGDDETVEIKKNGPHIFIHRVLGNESPGEHAAQIQGGMWVTDRKFCNLITYTSPKIKPIVRRIKRDDNYIARLAIGVKTFCDELDEVVAKLRRHG